MITPNEARFNLRGEKIFNYWEEKMNSPQIYTDSCKEVLRQTMLNQEVIFRKQVNELHRLYMIQKALMDDFEWREYSGYNSSRQFAISPFENQIRYEPQGNGQTFSTVPMVGTTHFTNNNLQERRGLCSRFEQPPIDLQLSSGLYINSLNADLLEREEDVKLSLSIGGESKIIQSFSQHIIDLEEDDSVETVSNETNAALPLGCDTSRTASFLDERQSCPTQKPFDQGVNECRNLSCDNNTLVKDQVVSSCKPVHFDLNLPEFHEDNCSSPISSKAPNTKIHSCNISSTSTKTNEEASDSKACTIDLESLSGPTSDRSENPDDQNVETDVMIQKAALSLIYISLENENTVDKGKSKERPQSSTDSYESIVLKLKESHEDGNFCVSSNAFETDEKDCGIKLKRGRRMKDFQKDILPGLASLSRREIWEDVKIMEGVIRSREYKKLKANKMVTSGERWFTPVRSRRSRLNYVGRRYYS